MCQCSALEEFYIGFPDLKGSPELDIIMRYLSLKQMCLRKFTLRVSLGDPYKVPSTFFQLKHLTHVELFSCVLKPDDDFCGFENLTSLNLFRVRISFNGLISFLKNCKRLTSLILMTHDGDLHEPSTFGFEELAASIPNIKHLQLGSCPFRLLSACGGLRVQHSSFNKLKSLRLTGVCFTLNLDLRGIQYLVTNSLELEKLEIMEFCQLKDMPVGVVDLSCHPRKMVYLNKLRSVEIQRFDCFGKGVDLIKFIMIRSPNLKVVIIKTIYPIMKKKEENVRKLLSEGPCASSNAVIYFPKEKNSEEEKKSREEKSEEEAV